MGLEHPWMQFLTRDWLNSKELHRCSRESRSVLIDLMCLAHEGTPYGYLCDKFGALSDEYMASKLFLEVATMRRHVIELVRFERISEKDGVYFIPRMVRDAEKRDTKSKAAKGGKSTGKCSVVAIADAQQNAKQDAQQMPGQNPSIEAGVSAIAKDQASSGSGSGNTSKIPNTPLELDEQWIEFSATARGFWLDLIDEDLAQWRFGWNALDPEQKALAIQRLKERIAAGQDPAKVFKPTYFSRGEWRRPVAREPPKNNQRSAWEAERQRIINNPNPRLTPGV